MAKRLKDFSIDNSINNKQVKTLPSAVQSEKPTISLFVISQLSTSVMYLRNWSNAIWSRKCFRPDVEKSKLC